jgi:hypothetical protein
MPPVRSEDELNEPFDLDKPPPEPPDIFDPFESQRYISKPIQWSLEASTRERSRPHLVDRDNGRRLGLTALRYIGVSQDTDACRTITSTM